MDAATQVCQARKAARLSQRELAARAGIPQSAIARIERGRQVPRVDTFARLLAACGWKVVSVPIDLADGDGVDRSLIREWVRLSPAERLDRAAGYGDLLGDLRSARPVGPAIP